MDELKAVGFIQVFLGKTLRLKSGKNIYWHIAIAFFTNKTSFKNLAQKFDMLDLA